jgi:Spy/CpxP family protein refolding chaperone
VNTWKIIFATLVIFIAGVVTGGLLVGYSDRAQQKQHRLWSREFTTHRLENKQPAPVTRDPGPREPFTLPRISGSMPKGLRMDFLQNLDREIQLTDEQRARIETIITEGQERNKQLWSRVLPELRREMQTTKDRIRAVLNPEQVRRFEELMKQRPQRRLEDGSQPGMRPRDLRRQPLPPRDGPLPEGGPQPRPPAGPSSNP